jgi:uncharacterized Rmd1/YagE family protein
MSFGVGLSVINKRTEEQIFWLIIILLLKFVLLIICGIVLTKTEEGGPFDVPPHCR